MSCCLYQVGPLESIKRKMILKFLATIETRADVKLWKETCLKQWIVNPFKKEMSTNRLEPVFERSFVSSLLHTFSVSLSSSSAHADSPVTLLYLYFLPDTENNWNINAFMKLWKFKLSSIVNIYFFSWRN